MFSSSTDSSISQIIHHTFHQPLVTDHRLQEILAYHRSIKGLSNSFHSPINQHTTSSSLFDSTFSSKSSNFVHKNIDSTQQHIIQFDPQDLDDNDYEFILC